jgi:hypothetical protein
MTTITLVANTNYSALTVANDDTIDCNGFRLTIDVQPSETGIAVITPAKAGKVTVSGAYDLETWAFTAGTSALIDGTLPSGSVVGSVQGGTGSNSFGCNVNNGTILTATGGTGQSSYGVKTNNSVVVSSFGGAGYLTQSHGVNVNNGTVTTATGGSGRFAHGIATNNATCYQAIGGTASPDAYGINVNNGTCLRATNGNSLAIKNSSGDFKLIDGPNFNTTLTDTYSTITTIYSIGTINPSAIIPGHITVVELSVGSGGTAGFTGIRGMGGG